MPVAVHRQSQQQLLHARVHHLLGGLAEKSLPVPVLVLQEEHRDPYCNSAFSRSGLPWTPFGANTALVLKL